MGKPTATIKELRIDLRGKTKDGKRFKVSQTLWDGSLEMKKNPDLPRPRDQEGDNDE